MMENLQTGRTRWGDDATPAAMRLLVVEDDPTMSALIVRGLERIGYVVDAVDNGPDALWNVFENGYDAVVLDAMIPPPDGFEVCRRMREEGRWEPVLLVTARDAVPDRVRGLDAGADDYLLKPFTFAELYARLRAVIRRHPHARPAVLQIGDLSLDPVSRLVRRGATRIALSPRELALLAAFMGRPGEVLTPMSETVAGAAHRLDALAAQLLPEVPHVDVDDVGAALVRAVPHVVDQVGAGEHLARVPHQLLQQRELLRRQGHRLAVQGDRAAGRVECDATGGQHGRAAGRHAAGERAHPGPQLRQRHRLHEVVVGARVERGHPVGDGVARGQHEDRGPPLLTAQRGEPPAQYTGQGRVILDQQQPHGFTVRA